ncbi:MAG: glucosamine-6-phosphate deaminase [Akkermansiaceae bacterium]
MSIFPSQEVVIGNTADVVGRVADEIEAGIRERAQNREGYVLGLATGSTPIPLYAELVRRYREEDLSFQNVITFNLDEYEGLKPNHPESYHAFMEKHLIGRIDIRSELSFLPPGIYEDAAGEAAEAYEEKIREFGGIDLQILGIGRDGHIGFNEPGSARESRTRRVSLAAETREDAAPAFGGLENVPTHAMTMGVATILDARRIVLMARGEGKREIVARAMNETVSSDLPATFLQDHSNAAWYLDGAAAGK